MPHFMGTLHKQFGVNQQANAVTEQPPLPYSLSSGPGINALAFTKESNHIPMLQLQHPSPNPSVNQKVRSILGFILTMP